MWSNNDRSGLEEDLTLQRSVVTGPSESGTISSWATLAPP